MGNLVRISWATRGVTIELNTPSDGMQFCVRMSHTMEAHPNMCTYSLKEGYTTVPIQSWDIGINTLTLVHMWLCSNVSTYLKWQIYARTYVQHAIFGLNMFSGLKCTNVQFLLCCDAQPIQLSL